MRPTVLHRLAKRVEDGPRELCQLVKEERAGVREAHHARYRWRTPSDERQPRRDVVRGAERPRAEEGTSWIDAAAHHAGRPRDQPDAARQVQTIADENRRGDEALADLRGDRSRLREMLGLPKPAPPARPKDASRPGTRKLVA